MRAFPLRLCSTAALAALLTACATAGPNPPPVQSTAKAPAGADRPAAPAGGPAGQPAGAAWTHEKSDLKPDPAVRFGRLPNGMRYAVVRNATPKGEASLRLRIDAGSLMERDDQQGLAHFMEHMIFNGTRNVPEGEFVRRLERLGLAFGPDTNAFTSFDQTVYMLELPETNAEVVDTALLLMREAAGEALLETEAINRERGVVLSEERTRDTPGLRNARAQYDFFMKGQLPPKRFPIGKPEVLRSAPRERFVEFYEGYYRPENATFVAVGDFDPDEMERKIRERFSDWRGQGPPGVGPNLGPVAEREFEVRTFIEPGAPASVQIAWTTKPELDPDTRAERREDWVEALGLAVMNRRFERLARSDKPPFIAAGARHGTSLDALDQTTVRAAFQPGRWRRALEAIEQEQRRIVQYGITQAELNREITETRASLQTQVAGAGTRRSSALASSIVGAVNDEEVVTAPAEDLAVFEEAVRGLTAEHVSGVLKTLFEGEGPLVFLSSPETITEAAQAVARAFQQSRQVAVAAPADQAAKAWAYTDFGTPGRVAERRVLPDLVHADRRTGNGAPVPAAPAEDAGIHFIRFENGVRLTVRPSQNRKDQILVNVRAGDGELDLPLNRPSPGWVADAALTEGGLGKLTTEEIEEALGGKVYSAGFGIDDDAFVLSGATRPEDFGVQMQVLAAYLTDPAWRPQGLERLKAFAPNLHQQLEATPGGVLGRELPRLLRSGDPRFGLPPLPAMTSTRIGDVRRAVAPLTTEPIEVVITGDVTVDQAVKQTAATFGALPPRRDAAFPPAAARTPFPGGTSTPVRLAHKGRPDQAIGYIAWPTADFPSDPQRARTLRVLEQVMRLRLLDEIREKQGVTYSPSTGFDAAWVYPDFGYISASIEAPPDKLDAFFGDAVKIARELRERPVTQDELDRAVRPRVEAIQRSQASNEYWLGQLSGAQTDRRKLDAIEQSIPGLRRVTPADVQRVARRYLLEPKAFRVVVTPEAKGAAAGGR